jgi:hypothetical protein
MAALNRQLIQAQSAVDRQTELLADSQVCLNIFFCFVEKNIKTIHLSRNASCWLLPPVMET